MTDLAKPLLLEGGPATASQQPQPDLDGLIKQTREDLQKKNEKAITHLVYAALDHASTAFSHPDHTIKDAIAFANEKSLGEWRTDATSVMTKICGWVKNNPVKVSLMVVGLGLSAFKAKTMVQCMKNLAKSYCEWSQSKPLPVRFGGFLVLMSVRLIVSTLVPPTSPAFGIIISAATPATEKWTAMPCFLLASAAAGAWPWILDTIFQVFTKEDFSFTMYAKYFADNYPLTCWTGPAMSATFHQVYLSAGSKGTEEQLFRWRKMGASFAVIVGHVVPFMGAQTTIIQRFFLPHPLDTIISQPFGMTEDLVSMAMAEAISNPVLASWSLTALIVFFNLARGLIFSGRDPKPATRNQEYTPADPARNSATCAPAVPGEGHAIESASTATTDGPPPVQSNWSISTEASARRSLMQRNSFLDTFRTGSTSTSSVIDMTIPEPRDWVALATAVINVLVGVASGFIVGAELPLKASFCVVAVQILLQLLVVPMVLGLALKPVWNQECSHRLPDDWQEHGDAYSFLQTAVVLKDGVSSSIRVAVEGLNKGSVPCEGDFCIVYSASHKGYYLLFKPCAKEELFASLGVE